MTAADTSLPEPGQRWTLGRKLAVVAAIHSGHLSLDEIARLYAISVDEFAAWERVLKSRGVFGLYALPRKGNR